MNFTITAGLNRPVSDAFLQAGIPTFVRACEQVKHLPYGRNSNRFNPLLVLQEQRGTCSSKHALLAMLAQEQQYGDAIQLMLGIFAMHAQNTPAVQHILSQHALDYIPEAHCYLRIHGEVLDITQPVPICFEPDLLQEQPIQAADVATVKVQLHQHFISEWVRQQPQLLHTPEAIWHIRELCIAAL